MEYWKAVVRIGGCSLLMLLPGCVNTRRVTTAAPAATGSASWHEAVTPGTVHYKLAMGDVSSGATPFKRVTPIYPASQLTVCPPPQEIPALLIVNGSGSVDEVRVADENRADAGRRAFIGAVRAAALQWEFNPLTISHWAADKTGGSHVVDSETKPFSLGYDFRFECHGGKSVVMAAAAKP